MESIEIKNIEKYLIDNEPQIVVESMYDKCSNELELVFDAYNIFTFENYKFNSSKKIKLTLNDRINIISVETIKGIQKVIKINDYIYIIRDDDIFWGVVKSFVVDNKYKDFSNIKFNDINIIVKFNKDYSLKYPSKDYYRSFLINNTLKFEGWHEYILFVIWCFYENNEEINFTEELKKVMEEQFSEYDSVEIYNSLQKMS